MTNSNCSGFVPDPCVDYPNCTGSGFIPGWTEQCCQPESVKNTREVMLSVIGVVFIVGTICNVITIITFIYLCCFPERIRRKFGQEFTMLVKDPVFYLIFHLSICDLLCCIFGLPSYWIVHYDGYFPYSQEMCKLSAFVRNVLGSFSQLLISKHVHAF